MAIKKQNSKEKILIGWREWVQLPDLKIPKIKVKIDTGAKTSALHAFQIEEFIKQKKLWIKFKIHPNQRSTKKIIKAQAPVIEMRQVKDSGGKITNRHVIETSIAVAKLSFIIEVTLINRDEMGFRMLLGRDALKKGFIVDPTKSFLLSKKSVTSTKKKATTK